MELRLNQEGGWKVNKEEKAKIILESMDQYIQINWNLEEFYLRGIVNGIRKIEEMERGDNDGDTSR